MMTIKIISSFDANALGTKTTLYSAKWVERKTLGYSNPDEFKTIHEGTGKSVELFMMWPQKEPPTSLTNPDDKTEFQQLFFVNAENNEQILFLQHCYVYIMEAGQTVDSFRC